LPLFVHAAQQPAACCLLYKPLPRFATACCRLDEPSPFALLPDACEYDLAWTPARCQILLRRSANALPTFAPTVACLPRSE